MSTNPFQVTSSVHGPVVLLRVRYTPNPTVDDSFDPARILEEEFTRLRKERRRSPEPIQYCVVDYLSDDADTYSDLAIVYLLEEIRRLGLHLILVGHPPEELDGLASVGVFRSSEFQFEENKTADDVVAELQNATSQR